MFIGENKEAHQAATQKLMEAVVHLRRASESLLAVQGMVDGDSAFTDIRRDRKILDSTAERYDEMFLDAAAIYFS
jgi:hypothetical protein